jgi:hypothetical protein
MTGTFEVIDIFCDRANAILINPALLSVQFLQLGLLFLNRVHLVQPYSDPRLFVISADVEIRSACQICGELRVSIDTFTDLEVVRSIMERLKEKYLHRSQRNFFSV